MFSLQGYFESLKLERSDVDITIFCPGPTTTEFLQTAFTGTTGETYNGAAQTSSKRMPAERCALLMATAIANKTYMNFVGIFPVPLLTYISLYYPNLKVL